ncbi:MAG: dienelactone hydrolase [Verrucomicrobia bacterium]|nr:dienelactone hydrolase [Verrucomicrobiota bacterium]
MAQTDTNFAARWLAHTPPVPEFAAPKTLRAWEKQRAQIRATLWDSLGKLPPCPKSAHVTTLSREERDGFTLEKFSFDNGAGATVPGYLLLPKNARGKSPAILYCHQHGGQYGKGGKEELFIAGNPVPVAPGPELARRGYVVLAIDSECFGERDGRGPGGPREKGGGGELQSSKFHLWFGQTLWGMIVRDDLIALDILCARPEVDAKRVGVTGFSMGATRAWWAMALDERLRVGVPVACLTRYQDLIRTEALAAHGIYYFVPGLLRHFDTEAVIALHAPRPVLFMTGDADRGSPVDGVRAIGEKVRPVYRLYGAEEKFRNEIIPGLGHEYLPEMWAKTFAQLDGVLKSK